MLLRKNVAVALLAVIVGGVGLLPALTIHPAPGEALVPDEWRAGNPGPYVVDVVLAVDEEWVAAFGPDSEQRARTVLSAAAENTARAGLILRPSDVVTWTSDDHSSTLHTLLSDLEVSNPRTERTLVVGLTAGAYDGSVDGHAHTRYPYLLVEYHPGHLHRDAYVLTHEIGHVFGLDHHVCEDGQCFMADHGYDPDEHWCPEHLELLQENAGYFQYTRGQVVAP